MKVTLTTNIGTVDAKALDLDFKKAVEGATLDLTKKTADVLIAKGWATAEDSKPSK